MVYGEQVSKVYAYAKVYSHKDDHGVWAHPDHIVLRKKCRPDMNTIRKVTTSADNAGCETAELHPVHVHPTQNTALSHNAPLDETFGTHHPPTLYTAEEYTEQTSGCYWAAGTQAFLAHHFLGHQTPSVYNSLAPTASLDSSAAIHMDSTPPASPFLVACHPSVLQDRCSRSRMKLRV